MFHFSRRVKSLKMFRNNSDLVVPAVHAGDERSSSPSKKKYIVKNGRTVGPATNKSGVGSAPIAAAQFTMRVDSCTSIRTKGLQTDEVILREGGVLLSLHKISCFSRR
jgi:hypothetical protein